MLNINIRIILTRFENFLNPTDPARFDQNKKIINLTQVDPCRILIIVPKLKKIKSAKDILFFILFVNWLYYFIIYLKIKNTFYYLLVLKSIKIILNKRKS